MEKISPLCGMVFNEPGCVHRKQKSFGQMERYQNFSSSLWKAYATVLLVRDPWHRYYSHVKQLNFNRRRGDHGMKNIENNINDVVDNQGEYFGTPEVTLAATNFLTQHLVPGFRSRPLECTNQDIQHAKQAVDSFDLVLNLFDTWQPSSQHILHSTLNLHIEYFPTRVAVHRSAPQLNPSQYQRFFEKNRCDFAIVEYVNNRIRETMECLEKTTIPFENANKSTT
mmetsp:Transcript_30380/g.73949  ORF Transcript_30380/g.73949 Transcript_30380/m.73949 type:complete len:225 (-) Transcript_30380:64-738(-)